MKTTDCTHFDNKTTLPICQFLARSNSAIDDRKTSRSRSRSRFFSAIDDLDLDRTTAIDRSRSISIARRSRHLWPSTSSADPIKLNRCKLSLWCKRNKGAPKWVLYFRIKTLNDKDKIPPFFYISRLIRSIKSDILCLFEPEGDCAGRLFIFFFQLSIRNVQLAFFPHCSANWIFEQRMLEASISPTDKTRQAATRSEETCCVQTVWLEMAVSSCVLVRL